MTENRFKFIISKNDAAKKQRRFRVQMLLGELEIEYYFIINMTYFFKKHTNSEKRILFLCFPQCNPGFFLLRV